MADIPGTSRQIRWAAILLAAVVGATPLFLYWLFVGRIPAVTPREASQMLADGPAATVIVDVRTAEEYASGRIKGARHWPWEEIAALRAPDEVREDLKGRRLLLICSGGIRSADATRRLRALGLANVWNVRGGLQAWISGCVAGGENFCAIESASGEIRSLPFQGSSLLDQFVVVATAYGVKPLYMLLSLLWAILLRRQRAPDLAALRWAMFCFFAGEAFCAPELPRIS